MRSVIMVCSGNTCRSPMAEALLRRMLPGANVSSAGLYAMNGMPASDGAQREMERRGLSLANHRSRQLTREMACGALLLCMTQSHLFALRQAWPDVAADALMHFAGLRGDVDDPFGGDGADYRRAADQIEAALRRIVDEGRLE